MHKNLIKINEMFMIFCLVRKPRFQYSRLSVALQTQGFEKGNKIHIVTNNNIHYHPLLLAAWRLGGVPSCGDSALNADTIQYQVL